MKRKKLNYRFHNPNPEGVTAEFLLKILVEANAKKVERAIGEAALMHKEEDDYIEKPVC